MGDWEHKGGGRVDVYGKKESGGVAGKIAFVIFLVILGFIVF